MTRTPNGRHAGSPLCQSGLMSKCVPSTALHVDVMQHYQCARGPLHVFRVVSGPLGLTPWSSYGIKEPILSVGSLTPPIPHTAVTRRKVKK